MTEQIFIVKFNASSWPCWGHGGCQIKCGEYSQQLMERIADQIFVLLTAHAHDKKIKIK